MSQTFLGKILKQDFYKLPTETVAYQLLGKTLVFDRPSRPLFSGVIVETEAYLGLEDPACHSFGGKKTPRSQHLYQDAGSTYVYLIYGMYHCLNFVTGDQQTPEAVLIRAIEPQKGIQMMKQNRKMNQDKPISFIASGPGRLCQAFGFDLTHNGWSLQKTGRPSIYVLDAKPLSADQIGTGSRVGIGYAGDACFWPLRFYIKDHPCVSKVRPL